MSEETASPAEPVVEAPKKKRNPVVLGIVAVALIAGVIYGFRAWSYGQSHVVTDDAQVTSNLDQVSPQVAGNVEKVLVMENESVKKGQLLVVLDDATYRTDVEQARANLALAIAQQKQAHANVELTGQVGNAGILQAQGQVSQTEGAIATSEADVARAQAGVAGARAGASAARSDVAGAQAGVQAANVNVIKAQQAVNQSQALIENAKAGERAAAAAVASAQATVSKAQRDAERAQALLKEGVISAQAADQAQTAYSVAEAALAAAQEQARAAGALVRQRQSESATATSQVAAAKAAVVQAQAQVRASQDQVRAADQSIRQAQAQVKSAQTAVQQATGRRTQASGTLEEANAAPVQVEISKVQTEQADAQVKLAKAALDKALLNLRRTKIYAPEAGQVSRKSVTIGAQVQPGTPLMAIVPDDDVWVVANFKETQLSDVQPGQKVEVEVDAFPGHKFIGSVQSLSAGTGSTFALLPPDNATGNFTKVVQRIPVKIVFEPDDKLSNLRAGMSAVVSVITRGN
jgi:membrane fusion protein (multidrug efflux system)